MTDQGRPRLTFFFPAYNEEENLAETVRRALEELPGMLDRVDALLADGVLVPVAPTAATLQVLCSVRALEGFADLRERVAPRACAAAARELFPDYPAVPAFLPRGWLS